MGCDRWARDGGNESRRAPRVGRCVFDSMYGLVPWTAWGFLTSVPNNMIHECVLYKLLNFVGFVDITKHSTYGYIRIYYIIILILCL